jgi:hypothetical protein
MKKCTLLGKYQGTIFSENPQYLATVGFKVSFLMNTIYPHLGQNITKIVIKSFTLLGKNHTFCNGSVPF